MQIKTNKEMCYSIFFLQKYLRGTDIRATKRHLPQKMKDKATFEIRLQKNSNWIIWSRPYWFSLSNSVGVFKIYLVIHFSLGIGKNLFKSNMFFQQKTLSCRNLTHICQQMRWHFVWPTQCCQNSFGLANLSHWNFKEGLKKGKLSSFGG